MTHLQVWDQDEWMGSPGASMRTPLVATSPRRGGTGASTRTAPKAEATPGHLWTWCMKRDRAVRSGAQTGWTALDCMWLCRAGGRTPPRSSRCAVDRAPCRVIAVTSAWPPALHSMTHICGVSAPCDCFSPAAMPIQRVDLYIKTAPRRCRS